MDEFERFLKKQPLREVPTAWRAEILPAATQPEAGQPTGWGAWLWPSPPAWAGLACIWIVILALNVASRPLAAERQLAERPPAPSHDMVLALAQQRRELAQLLGTPVGSAVEMERRHPPGPQSEAGRVTGEA
jgi:hypothetical protein